MQLIEQPVISYAVAILLTLLLLTYISCTVCGWSFGDRNMSE